MAGSPALKTVSTTFWIFFAVEIPTELKVGIITRPYDL
jgi:hypothetical protein